ncbi:MAG TPA: pilus assembly protein N-terminal domain-containing protein, partial [Candidatus Polarisedimenticolia bacterium]|nr:pilus assembly protein N-terminal domain-containing protein [Candidatus Polarisedimenticolia bacterium]
VRVLKVRLTGVKARSHKVEVRENELHIDLASLKGSRGEEGLPKLIHNGSEITAGLDPAGAGEDKVEHAVAPPESSAPKKRLDRKMEAVAIGPPVVTPMAPAPAVPPAIQASSPGSTDEPIVLARATADEATTGIPSEGGLPMVQDAATAAPRAAAPPPAPAPARPAYGVTAGAGLSTVPLAMDEDSGKILRVAAGRSMTLNTGLPVTRVSISNPSVAEPVAISPTQLLINGLAPGVVTLVLWPKEGEPVLYEVVVHLDTAAFERQMQSIFPGEAVRAQSSRESLVLSGSVSSRDVADKIVKLAGDFTPKVVNHMSGPGMSRRQVMLKVKFAEVNKTALTELGSVLHHVDPTNPQAFDRGTSGTGEFVPPAGNLINNPVGPDLSWGDAINLSFFEKSLDLGIFITALKTRGLFQELAEPTLIAADGQEASFLAGGEFPVPIASPGPNFVSVTVDWKKFGISLDFKPVIRDDGVIVMKVKPEVSSLDFGNAVLIEGFRIPSLIVRRAETEVELRSGQAFAIAGLYDRNLVQSKSKIPILGDIPLLGYLFRSKNLQKGVTELLVIVTPTIIEPLGSEAEAPQLVMPESFELEKPKRSGR